MASRRRGDIDGLHGGIVHQRANIVVGRRDAEFSADPARASEVADHHRGEPDSGLAGDGRQHLPAGHAAGADKTPSDRRHQLLRRRRATIRHSHPCLPVVRTMGCYAPLQKGVPSNLNPP